jgi:hypothetical protein
LLWEYGITRTGTRTSGRSTPLRLLIIAPLLSSFHGHLAAYYGEDKAMAKYMVLWEIDTSRTPEDAKAKKAQHLGLQELVKKHLKEGVVKDWGHFRR